MARSFAVLAQNIQPVIQNLKTCNKTNLEDKNYPMKLKNIRGNHNQWENLVE